ncbi:MAG: gliding motility-associated C-terminal domain-containing protein [Bacteroidota bacterium]
MRTISALALSIVSILSLFSLGHLQAGTSFSFPPSSDCSELAEASLFNGPISNLPDSMYFQIGDCGATYGLCLDIPIVDISNYQIFDNATPYANGIAGCDFDSLIVYAYDRLTGQGTLGPYILREWRVDGQAFSTPINDVEELVDSMNVWDPAGNWQNDATAQRIIGGQAGVSYSDMTLFVNATAMDEFLDAVPFISPNGTSLQFAPGPHQIVLVETATLIRDTLNLWVYCVQPDTIRRDLEIGQLDTICLDWSQLSLPVPDTIITLCSPMGGVFSYNLNQQDSCLQIEGMQTGVDSACFVSCDARGICDTTHLYVSVASAVGLRYFYDTLFEGEARTHCLDTRIFLGNPDTLYNVCADLSGNFVDLSMDLNSFCVNYEAISQGGTDEACIILCDQKDGECDTTMMFLTVRRTNAQVVNDTIYVNQRDTFCDWDLSNLSGPLDTIINFCEGQSGEYVDFSIDTSRQCLAFGGIDVGIDTACLLLVDANGGVDTVFYIVESFLPDTRFVADTIRPGLVVRYCLDTTQLGGIVEDSIFLCNDFQARAISLSLDADAYCIEVTGQFPGTDTLCVAVCDDFGVCDTSIFAITVSPIPGLPPRAVDDVDTTFRDRAITINVIENDDIPNLDPNNFLFYILPVSQGGAGPNNGIVIPNSNGTLQYVPDSLYCGGTDVFDYVVCNRVACDTARVEVFVECPSSELRFYSGFSPNGDQVNDVFVVEGIENYPDHTLYIYNRWGNQVLKATGYQNDWAGTWNGVELPDGTYFYVFEDGTGQAFSGWVVIAR